MFGALKKFFSRKKRRQERGKELLPGPDERLLELVTEARKRLKRFLITRSLPSGEIKRSRSWRLLKTGEFLFRLEAQNLSLLINTRPFLVQKEGEITGLLRMDEALLCRLLNSESDLAGFIAQSDPLSESSMAILDRFPSLRDQRTQHELPPLVELELWDDFEVYQVVARSSLNTLAHVYLHASPKVMERLEKHLSSRLKASLIQELEFLLSPGGDPALNPHSRVRSLFHFDSALHDFRREMGNQKSRSRGWNSRKPERKRLP